ncbi:MAG: hypothetical protein SPL39_06385 [Selenomonadaceae bacterium]|nr:hypothetical protein [Selenomonadaceae bacterium]
MQKHIWMTAVLAATLTLPVALPATASAENTEAEASNVLAETTQAETPAAATIPTTAVPAGAAETTSTESTQLPNPMVPYTSYREMRHVLGFRPLVLPRAEGYALTDAYIIDGTVADMRYTSRYGDPAKRQTVAIRTALASSIQAADLPSTATALSGIYSVDWQPLKLGDDAVLFAKINETSFVACWVQDGYLFACEGENFNQWDFTHRIVYDLIDVTQHYYAEEKTEE